MANWTPADLATPPALWLQADDTDSLNIISGASLNRWADSSGQDICASTAIEANYPTLVENALNSLPGISFTSTQMMTVTSLDESDIYPLGHPANYGVFAVFKKFSPLNYNLYGVGYDTARYKWGTVDFRGNGDPDCLWITRGNGTTYNTMMTATDARLTLETPILLAQTYTAGDLYDVIRLFGEQMSFASTYGTLTSSGGTAKRFFLAYGKEVMFFEFIVFSTALAAAEVEKLEGYLAWKWGLEAGLPADHPYKTAAPTGPGPVRALLDQPWSIKTGTSLVQPWGDAPVVRSLLHQPWGDAAAIRATLHQPWGDALAARALLNQPWGIMGQTRALLDQPWAITANSARSILAQGWDIADINPVRALLYQPWAIAGGGGESRYTVEVLVGGEAVLCDLVNIEGDLEEDSLSCELQLVREADYVRCQEGMEIVVKVTSSGPTETWLLKVSSQRIVEQDGSAQYIIEGLSQGAFLGPPYGDSYNDELEGLTADIAAELVGAVDWQTVSWELPAGLLSGSGQTGLELLKQLARAVGAVVQSDMDGSLYVQPEYRIPVNKWASATPDKYLTETLDCFSVGSTFEHRLGSNRFLVSDQVSSGKWTSPELSDLSTGLKEARAYQVPFVGDLSLTHTGGPWASIAYIGIEERQESQTVEFVGGAAQSRYPVYSALQVQWLQADLGTVTASEAGVLTALVDGQSLAKITYTTKCMLWQVRDLRAEQLQLVWEQ